VLAGEGRAILALLVSISEPDALVEASLNLAARPLEVVAFAVLPKVEVEVHLLLHGAEFVQRLAGLRHSSVEETLIDVVEHQRLLVFAEGVRFRLVLLFKLLNDQLHFNVVLWFIIR